MSAWIIYDNDGLAKCEARKLEYSGEYLGTCSVNVSISSPAPIGFELGDWLEYRGERFELNYDPSVIKEASSDTHGEGFAYENVLFNSLSDELTRCDFLDVVPADNHLHYTSLPNFSFFAENVKVLADRLKANLDRVYKGAKSWNVVVHPDFTGKTDVNVVINNQTCWDVLALAKSEFDANFIIRGRTITIGTGGIAVGRLFSYGMGNGLFKIERSADTNQKIVTRLRAYGSTRNLPSLYYQNLDGGNVPNNMAVKHLMLPSFPYETLDPYIDSKNMAALGVRESTVFFDGSNGLDEIYPTMEGMTAEDLNKAGVSVNATGALDVIVSAEQIEDNGIIPEGGELKGSFRVVLKDIGFDINEHLSASGTATLAMKSGMCSGREFEIESCRKKDDGYELTCKRSEDSGLGLVFPYNDYPIQSGDKFALLNIEMPDVYIKSASQRLLSAAEDYLAKNDYVRYSYTPTLDNIFLARQHDEAIKNGEVSIHDTIKEGDFIMFEDEDLGVSGSITIDTLSIKEDLSSSIIPEYDIVLRNEKSVGTIEKIQNQVTSILNGVSGGSVNAEQVKSIVESVGSSRFLSKTKDDTAKGVITFEKGWETKEFISGLLGKGAKVDEAGQAELESLFIRSFLEVPELRYNRVTVRMGDSITSCSAGIIKSVTILGETSGTIELKLEYGEFGSLEVGDIVFQIFSDMENKDNNSVETYDDGKGNRAIKGFATVMFKVTGVSGERNEIISYSLRPLSDSWKKQVHPFQFGTFSQRGNFDNTKPERQVVIYEGIYPQPYTRYMFGVNNWEFSANMIGMQLGDLSNLSVFGMDMTGYSAYLNNVYFTGQIRQLYIPQWMEGESSAQNGTLVFMGGDHYVAKGDTNNPPLFDLTDEDGNSLLFTNEEGEGNLLDLNNDEYDMLAKEGDDGVGIKSNVSYYLVSDSNVKPSISSLEWSAIMVQPTDLKPYLWKKTVITYTNLTSQTTIECISVRGKDGTSVSIKGSYDSEAELKSAFPNGPANASDAYIVGGDLYVWTGSAWKNVGAIKGEKGDTAHIHLKYANETASGTQVNVGGSVVTLSFTTNDGEDVGDWLGIYTDFTQADSMNISDYKWKNIKGSKGDDSTSYQMDSPIGAINFTSDGYPNPTSFVVSVKKQTGNGEMEACADFYLATWRYDGSWQLVSVSSVKTSSVTIIPAATSVYKQYRVTAHSTTTVSEANIIIEKGIGVSFDGMKGADGKDGEGGIFVYDCGLYDSTRAYYYKTIDGKVRRDKMVYEIGGAFYNFLVRSRQSDSSAGLVNTPPTSASGDANWEVMSQFQSLIANTVFGTNANIGGFMTSAEKMISQSGMFELNGSNGTMVMHQSSGTTWSVDENGVQSVGNENGERIVIDPNSKSMSVFDAEGIERTTFDGNEYTREQLVVTNGGSFILNANASNLGGKQLTSRTEEYETVTYPITGGFSASYVGVVQVSLSDFDASIVYEHTGASSDEIHGVPSGRVGFYLNTYTGNGGMLISKKLIASKTIDGVQTLQSRLVDGTYSVSAPSGYHQVVAEMSVCNFSKKGYATLTAKWSVSGVILSVESYISRHFANGMMLSKSSSEYFMAMVENGKMVTEIANGGNVYSFKDGSYSFNGIKQPALVYAARVTDSSESSSVSPSKTELVNNGTAASLVKTNQTGKYTLSLPISYGLNSSNMIVNLTGYGASAGETAPVKATLFSYSSGSSSMVLTIATSDDSSPNYGGFYIEIKKIV